MRQRQDLDSRISAALVEQTNAAIEQTEGQAQQLDALVDVFSIESSAGQRVRAA